MTTPNIVAPGTHIILDYWEAQNLEDINVIDSALREATKACGATILEINLHEFGEGYGVTGVAILAESHISIHTWPELDYVAIDIFMCGDCNPKNAIPALEAAFMPKKSKITEIARGIK